MGMPFSFYYLQFLYYLVYLIVLALGISWAVSALNVFLRDVGQIVEVLLQMGFWATPIVWDLPILPEALQRLLTLNPVYYVVRGYRESFIYFYPAWRHPVYETLYYWTFAAVTFVVGAMIFKKLKPQFADAL
jgi:lipopolysaccharide transport system permease protein/teichoic acid transport system permease protein